MECRHGTPGNDYCEGCGHVVQEDDLEDEHDRQRDEDEASYAAHVSGPACGWRS